jgi:hypothetical protein
MLDHEFEKFQRAFVRLAGLFRLRLQGDALDELARSYFKILSEHPLGDVFDAAKHVIEKQRSFPKPIDWLRAIPKRLPTPTEPDMTDKQAAEWYRAERLRWEDTPCSCLLCQAAGVTEKPLRFVPEFTDTDRERRVRNARLERVVTAGQWAHGDELAGYYRAKADFYERFYQSLGHRALAPIRRELVLVPSEREPGEEG